MQRNLIAALAVVALGTSSSLSLAQAPAGLGFSQTPAPPAIGWTQFREPSEGAYTVEVPQGWRATGGLQRYAASEVPTWLTVESPDGSIQLFIGDPLIVPFFLPSQVFPEGSQMPGLHGRAATVMRYRPGAEYAAMYGSRSLTSACANVRVQGSSPLPRREDELRAVVQNATHIDAGETTFTCQRSGRNFVAAVDAGTVLFTFPGGNGAGLWVAAAISGYLAPEGTASQTAQLLEHVTASFKLDPQFEAAVKQANVQEEEQARIANQQRAAAPPPALMPAPAPAPYQPTPYQSPRASACPDDLQQQRICGLNDGHLVVSGGCLRCI